MCHDSKWFTTLNQLQDPVDVVLGDRHALTATGKGKVVLVMILPNGESKSCTLHSVFYVPKLSYDLVGVSRVSEKDKIVKFTKSVAITRQNS